MSTYHVFAHKYLCTRVPRYLLISYATKMMEIPSYLQMISFYRMNSIKRIKNYYEYYPFKYDLYSCAIKKMTQHAKIMKLKMK